EIREEKREGFRLIASAKKRRATTRRSDSSASQPCLWLLISLLDLPREGPRGADPRKAEKEGKMEKEIIVGGRAVIEGVMMRAPNSYAVAVRRQDGSIVSKSERLPKLTDRYPILKTPVLRGSAVLIHSMTLGIKALNFSASVMIEDQQGEEAKPE